MTYANRDLSWLDFNASILEEAEDSSLPLLERIKFLGIFSSNLDEFFKVRVATLKRYVRLGKNTKKMMGEDPQHVLNQIQKIVVHQQKQFENVFRRLIRELKAQNIFIINEHKLSKTQKNFVREFFANQLRPHLVPIIIHPQTKMDFIKDQSIYLWIEGQTYADPQKPYHAVLELPTQILSRFVVLPSRGEMHYLIMLDDVVRFFLSDIFPTWDVDHLAAYTFKVTRDSELDVENEPFGTYLEKVKKTLKNRRKGSAVRLVYDRRLPEHLVKIIAAKMLLSEHDSLIPGGRYHNFKDLINFPHFDNPQLYFKRLPSNVHPVFKKKASLFKTIQQQDVLLHFPYQRFDSIIDLLREAAIDPQVSTIRITLYRVAKNSRVINALINAVRNGKKVFAVIEIRARFDEEANIEWSQQLVDEGAIVVYGVAHLKIHSKLILITRRVGETREHREHISCIGTGNYNEVTARYYTDHTLLTADTKIGHELKHLFEFFEKHNSEGASALPKFDKLVVAPQQMRHVFADKINQEIVKAQNKLPCGIFLKMNNLEDWDMIDLLLKASTEGVPVRLIVRGICSLVPNHQAAVPVQVVRLVDRYLEHTRIFCFGSSEEEQDIYISSADWMYRNLNQRIEVACPIKHLNHKQEIIQYLELQWNDKRKGRRLEWVDNAYHWRKKESTRRLSFQETFARILTRQHLGAQS